MKAFVINTNRRFIGQATNFDVVAEVTIPTDGHCPETSFYISDAKRPGKFPKHKNYDKNIEEPENNNLIDVLYKLYQRHSTLWDLEDKRRDKRELDNIRLSYCDEVSVINKKRNDLVEQVDKIIDNDLKSTKHWGKKTKLWGDLVV